MEENSAKAQADGASLFAGDAWFDPIEAGKLRATFAADGCAIHTPPKRGMVDPPAWNPALRAKRHHVENLFSRMKDWTRIALRRDKTR